MSFVNTIIPLRIKSYDRSDINDSSTNFTVALSKTLSNIANISISDVYIPNNFNNIVADDEIYVSIVADQEYIIQFDVPTNYYTIAELLTVVIDNLNAHPTSTLLSLVWSSNMTTLASITVLYPLGSTQNWSISMTYTNVVERIGLGTNSTVTKVNWIDHSDTFVFTSNRPPNMIPNKCINITSTAFTNSINSSYINSVGKIFHINNENFLNINTDTKYNNTSVQSEILQGAGVSYYGYSMDASDTDGIAGTIIIVGSPFKNYGRGSAVIYTKPPGSSFLEVRRDEIEIPYILGGLNVAISPLGDVCALSMVRDTGCTIRIYDISDPVINKFVQFFEYGHVSQCRFISSTQFIVATNSGLSIYDKGIGALPWALSTSKLYTTQIPCVNLFTNLNNFSVALPETPGIAISSTLIATIILNSVYAYREVLGVWSQVIFGNIPGLNITAIYIRRELAVDGLVVVYDNGDVHTYVDAVPLVFITTGILYTNALVVTARNNYIAVVKDDITETIIYLDNLTTASTINLGQFVTISSMQFNKAGTILMVHHDGIIDVYPIAIGVIQQTLSEPNVNYSNDGEVFTNGTIMAVNSLLSERVTLYAHIGQFVESLTTITAAPGVAIEAVAILKNINLIINLIIIKKDADYYIYSCDANGTTVQLYMIDVGEPIVHISATNVNNVNANNYIYMRTASGIVEAQITETGLVAEFLHVGTFAEFATLATTLNSIPSIYTSATSSVTTLVPLTPVVPVVPAATIINLDETYDKLYSGPSIIVAVGATTAIISIDVTTGIPVVTKLPILARHVSITDSICITTETQYIIMTVSGVTINTIDHNPLDSNAEMIPGYVGITYTEYLGGIICYHHEYAEVAVDVLTIPVGYYTIFNLIAELNKHAATLRYNLVFTITEDYKISVTSTTSATADCSFYLDPVGINKILSIVNTTHSKLLTGYFVDFSINNNIMKTINPNVTGSVIYDDSISEHYRKYPTGFSIAGNTLIDIQLRDDKDKIIDIQNADWTMTINVELNN